MEELEDLFRPGFTTQGPKAFARAARHNHRVIHISTALINRCLCHKEYFYFSHREHRLHCFFTAKARRNTKVIGQGCVLDETRLKSQLCRGLHLRPQG